MRDAQITRYVGDVHVHTRKTGARELDVAYDATRPLPTYMATESRACGGWQYKERVRWAMLALAVHGGRRAQAHRRNLAARCASLWHL